MTDYNKIMQRVGIKKWVEEKGVKEVWIWGYHGGVVGLWESNMAGPFGDISNSNRDPKDLPVLSKTYTVYHYNYQRGASEAVEDHMHQIEAVLNYVDGRDRTPPEQWPSLLFWGKFVGSDRTHKIVRPGCGWAHYPPNAEQDYDWANKRFVETDIEDWKPDGSGKKQRMNCDRWGGDSLKWFVYWMQNIPGADNGLDLQRQAAEQLVDLHRGLRHGDEAEDDAGGRIGSENDGHDLGKDDVMLKGYTLPRTPQGTSSLVTSPPWHYVGNCLTVEFEADPQTVASFLPPDLSSTRPSVRRTLRTGSTQASPGKSTSNPIRSQYRETIFLISATHEGNPCAYCPFIWVGPRQGQRVLTACSGKDLEHVVIVPTASAAFHGHAVFLGMLLQQGQREAIQPGEVLAKMLITDA